MNNQYDIIIIGGGLVGASLAIALAAQGFNLALVEEKSPLSKKAFNDRSIVISHTSKKIFQALDIWQHLQEDVCPIQKIHVSDRSHLGFTKMDAPSQQLSALGYVSSASKITEALDHKVSQFKNIDVVTGQFLALENLTEVARVLVQTSDETKTLEASLVVAADGQNSAVRVSQQIAVKKYDYEHKAVICKISLNRDHQNIAYERFTDRGSIAMLPLLNQQCAVIWACSHKQAEEMLQQDDESFLASLQHIFGYRLGRFMACAPRTAVPLQLVMTKEQIRPRLVLLGNAAHTLHPIAGQGLNLGLRDMAVLAENIVAEYRQGGDIGSMEFLRKYVKLRHSDQVFITSLTHQLIGIFSNSFLPLSVMRDVGLILIEVFSPLKYYLIDKALGKSGRVSRLACGLPLG